MRARPLLTSAQESSGMSFNMRVADKCRNAANKCCRPSLLNLTCTITRTIFVEESHCIFCRRADQSIDRSKDKHSSPQRNSETYRLCYCKCRLPCLLCHYSCRLPCLLCRCKCRLPCLLSHCQGKRPPMQAAVIASFRGQWRSCAEALRGPQNRTIRFPMGCHFSCELRHCKFERCNALLYHNCDL